MKELRKQDIKDLQEKEAKRISQKFKKIQSELSKTAKIGEMSRIKIKKEQDITNRPSFRLRIPSLNNIDLKELQNINIEENENGSTAEKSNLDTKRVIHIYIYIFPCPKEN